MIRQITFLLFFTLLFTACAERGHTPKPVVQEPVTEVAKAVKTKLSTIEKTSVSSSSKPETIKVKASTESVTLVETLKERSTATATITPEVKSEEESFFTLSHENKKTISGIFIVIIGILILL